MTALVVVALILAALGPVPPLLGIRSPAIRRGATALGVVGVVVAAIAAGADGTLFVSEDANNTVWCVSYSAPPAG